MRAIWAGSFRSTRSRLSEMEKDEDLGADESLGDSFRQARREMWIMLAAWVFFFLWVMLTCSRLAFADPDAPEGRTIPTLFGMPKWVALGIAIPWIASNGFIIWFALGFMKDTALPEHDSNSEAS